MVDRSRVLRGSLLAMVLSLTVLGVLMYINARNPSQPVKEPAYVQEKLSAQGDSLRLDDGTVVLLEQPRFLNSLMPFGTLVGIHTNLILNPEDNKKNCLGVFQVEIEPDRALELTERFSAGIITPKGKFYPGTYHIPNANGILPSKTIDTIPASGSRVYFVAEIPRNLVEKGGDFEFCLYVDDTKYAVPFDPAAKTPLLKAGDVLEGEGYRLELVDMRQGKEIFTSNDPETYMYHDTKSSYNGFIEVIVDVTNLSDQTENILRSIECRRVFEGDVEGPLSSSIMENQDMTGFTPMGLYGVSGVNTGRITYHGVGATNNSEVPPGKTYRVHFFWNRKEYGEKYWIHIDIDGSSGYVYIP